MKDIESKAPFREKEQTAARDRWVTNNTPAATAEF
jgi:hypothetical protein